MRFSDPEANIERFKLEPGMLVADFGAGSGSYTIASARAVGRRGVVYSIDIQQELLSRIKNTACKEGFNNVETVWGDIETLGGSGLLDGTIDAVIISNILFLLDDKDNLVKEVSRVLKRNGKVLVVDWKDSFGGLGPKPESIVPSNNTKDLFEKYGFSFQHEIQAGAHHYGIVFKRSS